MFNGADIKTVKFGWQVCMAVCRPMKDGLYVDAGADAFIVGKSLFDQETTTPPLQSSVIKPRIKSDNCSEKISSYRKYYYQQAPRHYNLCSDVGCDKSPIPMRTGLNKNS